MAAIEAEVEVASLPALGAPVWAPKAKDETAAWRVWEGSGQLAQKS